MCGVVVSAHTSLSLAQLINQQMGAAVLASNMVLLPRVLDSDVLPCSAGMFLFTPRVAGQFREAVVLASSAILSPLLL